MTHIWILIALALSQEKQRFLSNLLGILKPKFGVDINFQKDRNGEIRGYDIADYNRKMALDGSKVMKLSELIDFAQKQERKTSPLDIYRNLFSMEVRKSGVDGEMLIQFSTAQSILARCRHVNRHGTSTHPKVKEKMWQSG